MKLIVDIPTPLVRPGDFVKWANMLLHVQQIDFTGPIPAPRFSLTRPFQHEVRMTTVGVWVCTCVVQEGSFDDRDQPVRPGLVLAVPDRDLAHAEPPVEVWTADSEENETERSRAWDVKRGVDRARS